LSRWPWPVPPMLGVMARLTVFFISTEYLFNSIESGGVSYFNATGAAHDNALRF